MFFLWKSDKIMSKKLVFAPRGLWTHILSILEGPEALWKGFWRLQGGVVEPGPSRERVREAPGQAYKS